ncbi:MAG: ABC transporter permease [Tenericutes bacterium]|nr:ABC transporter permease [Mycoplasmatota bacterium]
MNKALLKSTLKSNYFIFIIFFLVLMMYSSIIIGMYNPDDLGAWDSMFELFSPTMLNAMGFQLLEPSLFGFVGGYLYGFIMLMFPMIYIIILGPRMIAKYVDSGSMSFLLSTPNTRQKISVTQAFYMSISIIVLIFVVALINLGFSELMFPGQMQIYSYFLLNFNLIALLSLLGGISFLSSCLFNESRFASGFGAGIPIGFFVINMLSNVSNDLNFLKYFTVFSLFDTNDAVIQSNRIYLNVSILLLLTFILYFTGVYIFKKKDLHI